MNNPVISDIYGRVNSDFYRITRRYRYINIEEYSINEYDCKINDLDKFFLPSLISHTELVELLMLKRKKHD